MLTTTYLEIVVKFKDSHGGNILNFAEIRRTRFITVHLSGKIRAPFAGTNAKDPKKPATRPVHVVSTAVRRRVFY